ncbi:MAG: hypothetical protein IPO15_20925 [Anaerolineae bacterium]|uniref:hypothetical protein n=1 Tax=Candidatus Amarolinea dominans TaxID=3140696 RepID=UPI0031354D2A|nr:hypothetical protein [Anaerolineae bacterium]
MQAPLPLGDGAPSVHDTAHSPRFGLHLALPGSAAQQPRHPLGSAAVSRRRLPGQRLIAARTGFEWG